jgi:dolichol-phosphate mannosyltransferase
VSTIPTPRELHSHRQSTQQLRLAFVTSAYNEELNLREFCRRCREVGSLLQQRGWAEAGVDTTILIADNRSTDNSLGVLEAIAAEDPAVQVLVNAANYGPEPSVANVFAQVHEADFVVALCSDLQDPPELAVEMVRILLEEENRDAVLAVKVRSAGNVMLRGCRRLYYNVLGYSTRLELVPGGYHGFGCYRQEVIDEALRLWNSSNLNLRMCLVNASQAPTFVSYEQPQRPHGKSSFQGLGYFKTALRDLLGGDATASRLALTIGVAGMILALAVAFLLLLNWVSGASGYERGVPTVMALVLGSFSMQMLMFAVLSRQIESLRFSGLRPRVRFRSMTGSHRSTRR